MVYVTVPSASRARLTIVLDKHADIRPCIIPSDEIQCLVLTIMTGDRVIVTEIIGVRYPDSVIIAI
jgi:hypothetical protein